MSIKVSSAQEPRRESVESAGRAVDAVRDALSRHSGVSDDIPVLIEADTVEIPREAFEMFATILGHMAAGRAVSIVPDHAELTTQQAADMLNVSRPFLIGLLEAGEIEFRKVGTHRRIKAHSLAAYQRADDRRRRQAADELTALNQDMGLI
ncbi:excisionase family DNA binding protein [Streptomyces sp. 840.1]|nr:excisionase family DNA binding protein [Streptomyces sp. 840.1]